MFLQMGLNATVKMADVRSSALKLKVATDAHVFPGFH